MSRTFNLAMLVMLLSVSFMYFMQILLKEQDAGAAPDSWFSHLAISVAGEETSTEWREAVSDEDYGML